LDQKNNTAKDKVAVADAESQMRIESGWGHSSLESITSRRQCLGGEGEKLRSNAIVSLKSRPRDFQLAAVGGGDR
jgi:hypothetical protein